MSETINVEIDVECSSCRNNLSSSYKNGILKVDPCSKCLDDKDEEGFNRGQESMKEE